jgi:hypothetical protein
MKHITATRLRSELYRILDEVARTGEPVVIERAAGKIVIQPAKSARTTRAKTRPRSNPKLVVGSPDDLVHFDWSKHWKPFL